MSNHVLNKLSLILPAAGYDQARQYQTDARHWATHSLPTLLNNYLNSINRNDELLYLEKIELTIPDFPWKLSDTEWNLKFEESILTQSSAVDTFSLVINQWFFYLRNGCFERSAIFKTVRETEYYLSSNLKYLSVNDLNHPENRTVTPSFLQRFFFQFSKGLVSSAIEQWFLINRNDAEKLREILHARLTSQPDRVFEIFSKLFQIIQVGQLEEKEQVVHILLKENGTELVNDLLKKDHKKGTPKSSHDKGTLNEKSIDCPNAGLVLLYPFIKPFFENIDLIKENAFIDAEAQKYAAQSLYFLATGESQGTEEQYLLPKLLCGIPLEEYVHFQTELSDAAKKEAEDLLQSVIRHWSKLQNTSADGLREAFLTRKGKLAKNGAQYTLQVEESGVDILLNSIPWGFRFCKLPWMPLNLTTEWY